VCSQLGVDAEVPVGRVGLILNPGNHTQKKKYKKGGRMGGGKRKEGKEEYYVGGICGRLSDV